MASVIDTLGEEYSKKRIIGNVQIEVLTKDIPSIYNTTSGGDKTRVIAYLEECTQVSFTERASS